MSELSGGQRRLVLLARALALRPRPAGARRARGAPRPARPRPRRRAARRAARRDGARQPRPRAARRRDEGDARPQRRPLRPLLGRLQLLPRGAAQADGAAAGRVRARRGRGQAAGAGLLPVPRMGAPQLEVRVARPRSPDAARARPQPRRAAREAPRSHALALVRLGCPRPRDGRGDGAPRSSYSESRAHRTRRPRAGARRPRRADRAERRGQVDAAAPARRPAGADGRAACASRTARPSRS